MKQTPVTNRQMMTCRSLTLLVLLLSFAGQQALAQKDKKPLKAAAADVPPALYINPQGNVGIGAPDPVNKLQLGGNLHMDGNAIFFREGATDQFDFIKWYKSEDRLDLAGFRGVRIGEMYNGNTFFPLLSIGTSVNSKNAVDIKSEERSGTHPTGLSLYVTGNMYGREHGMQFRTSDAGSGIGFTYNAIYTAGTNNDDLNLEVVKAGNLIFKTRDIARMKIDADGNLWTNGNNIYLRQGFEDTHQVIKWKPYVAYDITSDRIQIGGWNGVEIGTTKNNITNGMTVSSDGFVGVGTKNPEFPLEIRTERGGSDRIYYVGKDFTTHGVSNSSGRTFQTCSVFASGDFVTKNAFVGSSNSQFSDIRLKKDIHPSASKEDLATLMRVQISDYKMIDTIANPRAYKKVIAQQVQKVYPKAIGTSFNTLPDVFQKAETITHLQDSLYRITVASPEHLKAGDKIELKRAGAADLQVKVIKANSDKSFTIATEEAIDEKNTFVYGTVATDVLTVDYDAISMLNVSATQELYKIINKQQADIEALKKQNAELTASMTNFMARLNKMGSTAEKQQPKAKSTAATASVNKTKLRRSGSK